MGIVNYQTWQTFENKVDILRRLFYSPSSPLDQTIKNKATYSLEHYFQGFQNGIEIFSSKLLISETQLNAIFGLQKPVNVLYNPTGLIAIVV